MTGRRNEDETDGLDAVRRNPVMAQLAAIAKRSYEGQAAHLGAQRQPVPTWEDADVDDVLAAVDAATANLRLTSSMLDTAAALRRERMEAAS